MTSSPCGGAIARGPGLGPKRASAPGTIISCFLAVASAIHLVVVPAHLHEGRAVPVFFAAAAAAQGFLALRVARKPSRALALTAIVLNVGLIALWSVSRTVGIPIAGGHVEAVRMLDVAAVVSEVAAVAATAWLLSTTSRPRSVPLLVARAAAVSSFFTVFVLVGVGAVPAHSHDVGTCVRPRCAAPDPADAGAVDGSRSRRSEPSQAVHGEIHPTGAEAHVHDADPHEH